MEAINIHQLRKSYGKVEALKGIDLSVDEGQIFGLIGPDGSGKTSLIRILASLLFPTSGEATVLGLDPVKDYKKLRQIIGYMPGRFSLYQDLSVEENLALFASLFQTTIEENYDLVKDIYQQIEPFKKRRAGALSGGMKQKLALCCAMIHRPEILFLDEPTTGVDPVSRKEFWGMLKKLNKEGLTIFVSTPYMDEADQCDRIGLLQEGTLLAVDTPEGIVGQFKRKIYAFQGKEKHQLLRDLKAFPATHSVFSFGSEMHYIHQDHAFKLSEVKRYLEEKGHQDIKAKPIKAGIEDAFMELMIKDE